MNRTFGATTAQMERPDLAIQQYNSDTELQLANGLLWEVYHHCIDVPSGLRERIGKYLGHGAELSLDATINQ